MSMSAGLALMKRLGAKVSAISSPGLSQDTIASALRSEATSVTIYSIQVDEGEKQGWFVKQPIVGGNPLLIDPKYPSNQDEHYKGCFDSLESLRNKIPTADSDDYAFVLSEVPCMQDLISGAFLKNKGTGDFTPGSMTSSEEDFLVLNYLESTGTQYLDTNIKFQENDIIEIKVTPLYEENSVVVGAYEDVDKICMLGLSDSQFCGNSLQPENNSSSNPTPEIPEYEIGHTYTVTNTRGQWSCEDTDFGDVYNNEVSYTITLFARNTQQLDNFSRCRIHSYKHIRNGQVIMNLRPVNRLADLVKWVWNTSTNTWEKQGEVLEECVTFTSESAAQAYITANNLRYEYPDHTVSTVSPKFIEGYNPQSSGHVDKMTSGDPDREPGTEDVGLSEPCVIKNASCWAPPSSRPGTPIEFTQVIKQKIFSFG